MGLAVGVGDSVAVGDDVGPAGGVDPGVRVGFTGEPPSPQQARVDISPMPSSRTAATLAAFMFYYYAIYPNIKQAC